MNFSTLTILVLFCLANAAQAASQQFQTVCTNRDNTLQVQIFPTAYDQALLGVTETFSNGYKQRTSFETVINHYSEIDDNYERYDDKEGKHSYALAADTHTDALIFYPGGSRLNGQSMVCQLVGGPVTALPVFQKGGDCGAVETSAMKVCEKAGRHFASREILSEMHPDGGPECSLKLLCY